MPRPNKAEVIMTAEMTADFEAWWALYPRKTDKGHARKTFIALMRNKAVTMPVLMEATERYRDVRVRDPGHPKYTPYPGTWLNGEGWLDEECVPSTPQKNDPATARDAVRALLKRL